MKGRLEGSSAADTGRGEGGAHRMSSSTAFISRVALCKLLSVVCLSFPVYIMERTLALENAGQMHPERVLFFLHRFSGPALGHHTFNPHLHFGSEYFIPHDVLRPGGVNMDTKCSRRSLDDRGRRETLSKGDMDKIGQVV